jgi:nucleoprotein TPR
MSKQDSQALVTAEKLISTNAAAESIQLENSNIKKEITLIKSNEVRLREDNVSLSTEKQKLNALILDLQMMQKNSLNNEIEMRERLLLQVETLENQNKEYLERYDAEIESAKQERLRHEIDFREVTEQLTNALSELAILKQELSTAQNKLENKCIQNLELSKELNSANEKLKSLTETKSLPDENLSHQQQLEVKLSEISSKLLSTKTELEESQQAFHNMKAIAVDTEAALESMTKTYDEHKANIQAILKSKDCELNELRDKMTELYNEIRSQETESSIIEQNHENDLNSIREELKLVVQNENSLRAELENVTIARKLAVDDLQFQANIAQEAQQNYERELVKHAKATAVNQSLRQEIIDIKTELSITKKAEECAKGKLFTMEAQWNAERIDLQDEIQCLKDRLDELRSQNSAILDRIELHSNKENENFDTTLSSDNLNEKVIGYLRREKEAVEIKYNLLIQENKRFSHQLSTLNAELLAAQSALSKEEQKVDHHSVSQDFHQQLVEKINEINILRESNVMLRMDREKLQTHVTQLEAEVSAIKAKDQPLEGILNFASSC